MQIVIADYPYNELSDIARQQMKNLSSSTSDENQTQPQIVETQYYVQVGAFSRQNSALLRKSFFESKGYKVHLRTKWRDGKLLYLIWLGPGNTREEARTLGENLRIKLDIKYIIVSE
jgi:cell division septation protein DedD